jgi:hypothetical protein
MSESGDYSPGVWSGHDFSSARRSYDVHAGRSYDAAVSAGKGTKDLIAEDVKTDSTAPLIVVIDETGSMGDWPATMFSKLPYLEHETKEYLGDDAEICFMAIGDAHCAEKYPLQVRPFAKGLDLKARLGELVIEGGGGGQNTESYELAALFAAEKVSMPKAIKPIIIFIGDELPYDTISKDQAKQYCGLDIKQTLTTTAVFEKLKQKYAVYFIHKSYGSGSTGNHDNETDRICFRKWASLVGEDHIAVLPKADRVVDVIFGILAKEAGRIAYFEHELEDRQLKDKDGKAKVDMVYKSLVTIHKVPDAARKVSGASVMRKSVKKLGSGSSAPKTMKPLM